MGAPWFVQLRILNRKNWYIAKANKSGTFMQLASPIFVCILLILFQYTADIIFNTSERHPEAESVSIIPHCKQRQDIQCHTIVYAPVDLQFEWGSVEDVMRLVAVENGLDFDTDFMALPYSDVYPCDYIFEPVDDGNGGFNQTLFFEGLRGCGNFTAEYIFNNANATQNAIVFYPPFNISDLNLPPFLPPIDDMPASPVFYEIFYNATIFEGESNFAMNVKRAVDSAIFKLQGYDNLDLQVNSLPYPTPPPRLKGFDVVAVVGGIWFFIIPMLTFFILLTEIVQEKELRIRVGMRMMGMSDSAFWISWFINGLLFTLGSTLVLMAFGAAVGFDVVLNCDFFVFLFMFWTFGMALAAMAFFLSSIINSTKVAQTVGYAVILVGFVFQNILGSFQGYFTALLFDESNASWVVAIRWILSFYPPFLFSKIYYDVAILAASSIDTTGLKIVDGPGFTWGDMYNEREVEVFGNDPFYVPPMYESMLMMVADIFFFCLLTWYFDNTLAGEHGSPRHPLFFLDKSYWFSNSRTLKEIEEDKVELLQRHESYKPDVTLPKNAEQDVMEEAKFSVSKNCSTNPSSSVVRITGLEVVYRASRIYKSDSDVKAVNGIYLTIPEGQLLTVLGHNGAGKTTMIGVLTGLVSPSNGTVSINGVDAVRDVQETRKIMGVCPQHDILWSELTAAQHLEIFSELKGVPESKVQESIKTALETVGLWHVANKKVGEFSGGMKRRVSVAIASIGDPKIMFLDEPTTGMDPLNRRDVWILIEKLKKGRVIILTTHSMEEADVLSDRIAIMSHGNIEAVGNSLFLKSKYGSGYRIALVSSLPNGDTEPIKQFVAQHLPKAVMSADDGGSVTFELPFSEVSQLPKFFSAMDKVIVKESVHPSSSSSSSDIAKNPNLFIREWGLSHATLEEVFLRVAKKTNFSYENAKINSNEMKDKIKPNSQGVIEDHDDPHQFNFQKQNHDDKDDVNDVRKPLLGDQKTNKSNGKSNNGNGNGQTDSFPYRALLRKNISLQKKQKGTNCCQIITPLLVMAVLWLMQIIINSEFDDLTVTSIVPPSPLNWNILFNRQDPPEYNSDGNRTSMCYEYISFSFGNGGGNNNDELKSIVGSINRYGNGSGILQFIPQGGCNYTDELGVFHSINVPFFEQFGEDEKEMTEEIYQILLTYNDADLEELQSPPIAFTIPDGAVTYVAVDVNNLLLHYELGIHDSANVYYHRPNNFTRLSGTFQLNSSDTFNADLLLIQEAKVALMEMVHNSFIVASDERWQNLYAALPENSNRFIKPIQTLMRIMPYEEDSDLMIFLESFGSFLFPIAMSMQMPVYLFLIVMEKQDKLRELMKSSGMAMSTYWISCYIYFMILYLAVFFFFYLGGLFIQMRMFTQTDPILMFFFFFGWGNALIALAFLLSAFISSKRIATVVGYVIALIGSMMALFVAVNLYPLDDGEIMPVPFLLYAQFSFARGIYIMTTECSYFYSCLQMSDVVPGEEIYDVLISLYIVAFFYFLLALYLDQVLPSEFGVPKHPLFFLDPIKDYFKKHYGGGDGSSSSLSSNNHTNALEAGTINIHNNNNNNSNSNSNNNNNSNNRLLIVDEAGSAPRVAITSSPYHEDPDVAAERMRVDQNLITSNCPVVIRGLRKVFGDNKIAVKNLTMAINEGECFGLLGPNGAGKTTTINMLTGLYEPTSGTATVGGYDIRTEMDKVHLITGVCPQFSILWELLSCKDHILFYSRLKGIPKAEEDEHALQVLKEVGLDHCPERLAGQLSGGMKRRLSVAIALCGHNKVVFLDEPSTGLDPASRRQLWAIIQHAKKGRAIILTTHAMDEAEALANRIGIFVNGQLRVIGDQTHLKNRAGSGYRIYINYSVSDASIAQGFIAKILPQATLQSSFPGTSSYSVLDLDIPLLFKTMDEERSKHGITDWGCSQITLEDVFIHTVRTAENEDVAE